MTLHEVKSKAKTNGCEREGGHLLDFLLDNVVSESGGVGDDEVSLVPGGVVAEVLLQQGVHVVQLLVPLLKLLQHPLPADEQHRTLARC